MPNPRLASRYAKSLLDIAVEKNSVEETLKDLKLVDQVAHQSRDFAVMLRSPVVKGDRKLAAIKAIFGSSMHPNTMAFMSLLISKGREEYIPEIVQAFITQYNVMKHIKIVKLTTATPVSDVVKESIRAKVATLMAGNTIEMRTVVDPAVIGGFVLQMEDRLFDASVRRDLNDIKASLLDNSYVSKLN